MNSGVRNRTDSSRKRRESQSQVSDITRVELKSSPYDVWHDRAVLHFLTAAADRIAYVRQVAHAVKHGGRVIVSTFGPEGPERCCGLDVVRYEPPKIRPPVGWLSLRQELLDRTAALQAPLALAGEQPALRNVVSGRVAEVERVLTQMGEAHATL